MKQNSTRRAPILTIGGFDPCAGAGVLADVKTFEKHRLMGMAIASALTLQSEDEFKTLEWTKKNLLLKNITFLCNKYHFEVVKIGLIESLEVLSSVVALLKKMNSAVKIIWDPVLQSSSGYVFHKALLSESECLEDLFMITPNTEEISGLESLKNSCHILVTGGHNSSDKKGTDVLYTAQGKTFHFKPRNKREVFEKHGSGCVFSSAIASNILKGFPLHKAILNAKRYTEKFLYSNKTLLGYHW